MILMLSAAPGSGGISVAVKLMKSMGWTEGEGLGKERQGIAAPIMLQKTDARTGVIVSGQPMVGAQAAVWPCIELGCLV